MNPDEPLKRYVNKTKKHPFLELGYGLSSPFHKSITFFYPLPALPDFVYVGVGYDTYYGIPLEARLQVPISFLRPEVGAGIEWFPGFPLLDLYYKRTAGLSAQFGSFALGAKYTYHYANWAPYLYGKDWCATLSYRF
jgi:hypothetical protein